MKLFGILLFNFLYCNFLLSTEIKTKTNHTNIKLFHIERNKNKNQVHYAITLNSVCKPNGNKPIYAYWLDLEAKKPVISKIRWYEQKAYGIKVQKNIPPNQFSMILYAFPKQNIYVTFFLDEKTKRCKAIASTTILNKQALLYKMYVFAKTKFLIPSVQYVDVFGKLPNGSLIKERLLP